MVRSTLAAMSLLMVAAMPVTAGEQGRAGKPLNKPAPSSHKPFGSVQAARIVDDAAVEGGKALRLTVTAADTKPWAAGVNSFIGGKLAAGSPVQATVWMRVAQADGDTPAKVAVGIQQSEAPRREYVKQAFVVTGEWAPYTVAMNAPTDLAAYTTMVGVQIGYARQAIDIGPIVVTAAAPAT